MQKIRIMPTLLYKDFTLVKGVGFDSWRRVGSVMQAVKIYNMREVDELIFLDIAATREGHPPDFAAIDDFADECFMPLTVGGGVKTVDDVRRLLEVGADKVAIGTAAANGDLVSRAAAIFGSQCLVVAIDAKRSSGGAYEVYVESGCKPIGRDPVSFAQEMAACGAGEILLTSIDQDGTLAGYDLELIRLVSAAVSIPVVASGGAGTYAHMADALLVGGASAIAAASMFHFTEQTPLEAKRYLRQQGIRVRM